jgi:hydrogenase/urease accessory protein HupE
VVAAAGVLFGAAAVPPMAQAHWADQAAAEIVVAGPTARMTLTVPTGLLPFAAQHRDGRLSAGEIQAHRDDLRRFLSERIRLLGRYPAPGGATKQAAGVLTVEPGTGMPPATGLGGLAPATHTTLTLVYVWPAPIDALAVHYDLFVPGVPTASCLMTIIQDRDVRNAVFTPEHREAALHFGETPVWRATGGFIALGIRHILTGYDHMLFLLSLLMLGGSLRSLLKIVTAFTVAHSITLSLAVLGLVALPSRWVESAIALSITYVAAENVLQGNASIGRRWLVTFGFGLVHGLGFASALQEMHLPRTNIAASLVGFNLGVEIGQVAVVGLAFLALDAIRRCDWTPAFRRWVSVATAFVGLVWFVQRALLTS